MIKELISREQAGALHTDLQTMLNHNDMDDYAEPVLWIRRWHDHFAALFPDVLPKTVGMESAERTLVLALRGIVSHLEDDQMEEDQQENDDWWDMLWYKACALRDWVDDIFLVEEEDEE